MGMDPKDMSRAIGGAILIAALLAFALGVGVSALVWLVAL